MSESRYVQDEEGEYILSYRLTYHKADRDWKVSDYYGIVVEQYALKEPVRYLNENQEVSCLERDIPDRGDKIDRSEIRGLSESAKEAESFLGMVAEGTVMPVSLYEIYDDWMSAFHPRWDMG